MVREWGENRDGDKDTLGGDNSYIESQAILPLDKSGEQKKKQRNTSECKL